MLVVIPVKAAPIYSYDEGIQTLKTAPLNEIDRLAEEFAMGDFEVSGGGDRKEFYKLLNEKLDQIPRIKAVRENKAAQVNSINAFTRDEVNTVEQLTTLYATSSLLLDPPEVFAAKYPKFINGWVFARRNEIPQGVLGLFGLSMFQTAAVALNKDSLTNALFIETVSRLKDDPSANKGEIWDGLMTAVVLTNLRSVELIDMRIPKMQEEIIKGYLVTRINELKNDPKYQYEYLIKNLTLIVRGQYQFSFQGLDNWFEIIFANKNDPNKLRQADLLLTFYRSRFNWELKISPNEYLNRTLKLIDGCITQACNDARSRIFIAQAEVRRNSGEYEEARKLTQRATELLTLDSGSESPLPALIDQLKTQRMQGRFAEADKTTKQLREYLSNPKNFSGITPELHHGLIIVFGVHGIEFDLQMGRYEQAKKYSEEYLQYVKQYADESFYLKFNFLELKTRLISYLGQAEIGLGNPKKGQQLVDYARDYNGGGNNQSYLDLEAKFWEAFWNKDFNSAYSFITKAYEIYLSSIEVGTAIPLDIVNSVLKDEIALAKANLGKSEIDLSSYQKFLDSSVVNFEALYYANPVLPPLNLLENLALNWKNYSLFLGDDKYASFYAKRYVNLLQELRSNIRTGDAGALGSFTSIYKDKLQDMSNTFFAANDYDSASRTLNIIKENELLDFSTADLRSGIIETYLPYTKEEQKYLTKIKPILRQLIRLQELSFDAIKRNRIDEVKRISVIYNANIKQIQKALTALRKGADVVPSVVKLEPINKDKRFAIIQAMITQDRAIFNISSDGVNEQVTVPIARDKLRLLIYQSYAALSAPNQDWKPGLEMLDKQLFSQLNEKIKNLGIRKIYFVPDDALTFIPPDYIFNAQASGVAVTNLVSAKTASTKLSKSQLGVDVFAATKGGANFPPLPSARDEATFLGSYKFSKMKQESVQRTFVDENFTRTALTNSLTSPRDVVHIASHFKASGGTDKDVGLLLGDGSFLSLQDLFVGGQSFSGISLLTLSACETGVSLSNLSSQAKTFDGLAGLFAKRGVSQVLATLWKISDGSTADFMKVFYIYKESEGLSSSAALEKTKALFYEKNSQEIQLLSSKYPDIFTPVFNARIAKYSHPFYWAGFVLVSSGT